MSTSIAALPRGCLPTIRLGGGGGNASAVTLAACNESSSATSLAKENELLKKELKLLKLMVRERDTKIKNLENLINFENDQYCNSFTDWSIN